MENAIKACPEDLWSGENKNLEYLYLAFHTLFWLDYYVSERRESFKPPEGFCLEKMKEVTSPLRVHAKKELLDYLGIVGKRPT